MDSYPKSTFSIVGAGNVGKMLARRLLASGIPAAKVRIYDLDADKATKAAQEVGIQVFSLPGSAPWKVNVWLLASPPKTILSVVQLLADVLEKGDLVISFAAAVPLVELEKAVPAGVQVVRLLPSMTSYLGKGMNPVCYGVSTSRETRQQVERLLEALGEFIEVRDDQMNWCVGLSGAAMRAVLPALEGMVKAGIEAGFPAAEARRIAGQIMAGTAALLLETDFTFADIKAMTPMEMVDEPAVARIFYESARQAKEKTDSLQGRIVSP